MNDLAIGIDVTIIVVVFHDRYVSFNHYDGLILSSRFRCQSISICSVTGSIFKASLLLAPWCMQPLSISVVLTFSDATEIHLLLDRKMLSSFIVFNLPCSCVRDLSWMAHFTCCMKSPATGRLNNGLSKIGLTIAFIHLSELNNNANISDISSSAAPRMKSSVMIVLRIQTGAVSIPLRAALWLS